jgi:alcohol dehydrogenase
MRSSQYFEFFTQTKFISGSRSLEQLPSELESYDSRKPLVLTSKRLASRGVGKKLIKAFYDSNTVIGALFDEVPASPSVDLLRNLALFYRERACDSLIALGSGSVVDAAKAVNILVSARTDDLSKFHGEVNLGRPLRPLVFIPSGCLTGTEATRGAIAGRYCMYSDALYPEIVCIDPRMAVAEEPAAVVNSGMVALTQAVESCDGSSYNPVAAAYAETALELLFENLSAGAGKTGDKKRWVALANASAMAAIASSNVPAGMARLLGSSLAEIAGAPEGTCMGLVLPCALEHRMRRREPLAGELLRPMAGIEEFSATPVKQRAAKAVALVRDFTKGFKGILPETLRDLNIPEDALGKAADAVSRKNRKLKAKDCLSVLRHAWSGAPSK